MSIVLGIDVTEVSTTATHLVGSLGQTNSDTTKTYKYVQFNNGAGDVAAISGDVCYYYAVSGASAGQTTIVTMDRTDSGGIGAGVFQSVPADLQYCWIQVRGEATLTQALTGGADGNALTAIGAGADGALDVSALVTDYICAVAVDADAKIIFCQFPD